jgi:hypothetical protein
MTSNRTHTSTPTGHEALQMPPAVFKGITGKCTHVMLNHHLVNTKRNSNKFQPLKGHLQGVKLIHSGSVGQQNESAAVM